MSRDLITLTDPRSPVAEAYRTLRTNLEFSALQHPLHALLVTSAAPEEGKSAVVANLAVVLAQANKQVILVDADLRHPQQHEIFGTSNQSGLVNLLRGEHDGASVPLVDVGVPGLRLLPSGPVPPNPADLLALPRLGELLSTLKAQADMVLFDAPPVVVVTDALILGAQVDGVLLIISALTTKRDHARQAKMLLEKVNAHLVGAILNNVAADAALQRYYG
jgi:capsular exopolysaccharide synthesis family protein